MTTHKDERRFVDLEELLKEHDLSGVFRTPNCNQRICEESPSFTDNDAFMF